MSSSQSSAYPAQAQEPDAIDTPYLAELPRTCPRAMSSVRNTASPRASRSAATTSFPTSADDRALSRTSAKEVMEVRLSA